MSIKTTGSFVNRVDFGRVYDGLAGRGVFFTEEEKEKFEKIAKASLAQHDGGEFLGGDLGAAIPNLLEFLFLLIQNIASGPATDANGESMNLFRQTAESSSLKQMQRAMGVLHMRMTQEGGNLAAAAELVTGARQNFSRTDRNLPVDNMDESVYRQIRSTINLPWQESSHSADTRIPDTTPPQARTALLTPAR